LKLLGKSVCDYLTPSKSPESGHATRPLILFYLYFNTLSARDKISRPITTITLCYLRILLKYSATSYYYQTGATVRKLPQRRAKIAPAVNVLNSK